MGVSALFRWPCSISIPGLSLLVSALPLAMQHFYSFVPQRPFPLAMQHVYSFVSQVCHSWWRHVWPDHVSGRQALLTGEVGLATCRGSVSRSFVFVSIYSPKAKALSMFELSFHSPAPPAQPQENLSQSSKWCPFGRLSHHHQKHGEVLLDCLPR